jgi:hypothetical protein
MMRIAAVLAASVLCLAGCFLFDNPWDTNSTPTATFQIVISSISYGGTYVWSPQDNAYEAMVGSTPCSVLMDSGGTWHLTSGGTVIASSTSPAYRTLPPTSNSGWSGSIISGIDDSEGGICPQGGAPDGTVSSGMTLKVAFLASSLGNSATCQWQRSSSQSGDSPVPIGTGSTYTIQSGDYAKWIRVIITPTDSTGKIQGTPVVSGSVCWP